MYFLIKVKLDKEKLHVKFNNPLPASYEGNSREAREKIGIMHGDYGTHSKRFVALWFMVTV